MDKIFILILNNALVAGWMILAVLVFRLLFKKAPKWMNCLLWGLVAIRLFIPFSIESVFSLIPSAKPIPANFEYAQIPQIDSGIQSINTVINPVLADNFAVNEVASVNPIQIVIILSSYVWIIGVVGFMIYALVSFFLLKNRVRNSEFLDRGIMKCKSIDSPFILGIIKPCIYVPDAMDAESYACVIEHEKTHIRRGDHVWKPLGFLILSVYWFHPLCWLSYIMLCKDIEYACDEKVTKDKDKEWKAKYCQALLDCSSQRRMISACPVAFGEVSVKDRVKSVLNYKKPAFWIILVSIIITVIVAVCFMTNPKQHDQFGENNSNVMADATGKDLEDTVLFEEISLGEEEQEFHENYATIDHEYHVDENQLFVEMWAKAFCGKDGETIYNYSSDHVRSILEIEDVNGTYVFGASSPWPWNDEWYRIGKISDSAATIYYYALTSDPHVTVWIQNISFEKNNETTENIVKTISTDKYENIVLGSEFDLAYGDGLFWMDYNKNGVGEALNENAMLSSSTLYKDLFAPDTAARELLNLLPNDRKIPIEVLDGENENEKILHITFMEDNQIRVIKMIRPWGEAGIWIPFGWRNEAESENDFLPVENIDISKSEEVAKEVAREEMQQIIPISTMVANPGDENMGIDYVEENGQYIVEGDMVLRYKLVLVGQAPSAKYPVQYIVLTNDPDITWEQVNKSLYSSSSADLLPGTIIIGMNEMK
ncbi:MAG: M56 family metallopeptidase [Lachnospiraceae bacterium]